MDDVDWHPVMANTEILSGTFGLRAPVTVGGNLDRTKTVGLGARGRGSRWGCRPSHESCPLRGARPHLFKRARAGSFYSGANVLRADYFLRKRSSRTTSAP